MSGKIPRWLVVSLGVIAACGLIAVGCGDDDDGGSSSSTSDEPSTEQSSGGYDSSGGSTADNIDAAVEKCKSEAEGVTPAAAASAASSAATICWTGMRPLATSWAPDSRRAIAKGAAQRFS